jgi:hypothetical protein
MNFNCAADDAFRNRISFVHDDIQSIRYAERVSACFVDLRCQASQ